MKRSILTASAAAIFLVAGGAQAATTTSIDIKAEVDSKCGISSQASSITIGDLTDANAKVRSTVTDEIAQKLTDANVVAFCNNGGSNVKVSRAVLALDGATGNGLAQGDFAQYIRYNLDTSINGLALDSTSTDAGSTVAQRFGGHDSLSAVETHVKFTKAVSDGTAVASSNGANRTATNWSSLTDRRMAAGNYTGYVSIELTPAA
ncbi:hypothetical protein EDF56_102326 [Novosphingobium sp. PhB165]|uniref:hypothetical protein n=1 Tax=Novosphingobium sp. PhB165 TaxID=2485105 RepID=UPI00104797F7|nr:hypothetical protein [Novosphingobium sp. PhB165]TCM20663.1 hypothetical protein EDF56_102326 [Novosphingobium sp. PhB165]